MLTEAPQIQPHDLDAEQAILGAILLDPSALARVQEVLNPGDFYDGRHRHVYEAMSELSRSATVIDLLTVGDCLEQCGHLARVGGRGTLAEMLTTVVSAVHVAQHAKIVRDHAMRRRMIRLSVSLSQHAYAHASPDDLVREAERGVSEIATGRDDRSWCASPDLTRETLAYVDRVHSQHGALIGVPTGFRQLDTITGGWQRSDLIIVAARPSMGKTSFALGSALAAAQSGQKVGVLSLEMSRVQVGLRLHGMGAPLDVHALRTGSLTPEGWWLLANTAGKIEHLPIWVDDSSVLTVEKVAAKARNLKVTHGLDLLIVDYLQLMEFGGADSRQQGVADASRRLKLLAKDLDIPVLALSQLSRKCEERPDKRPMLSDLRDSGAIEQDADLVLFLYRDEVYYPETDARGVAEVLVRKHRNGPIGDCRLRFIDRYAKFDDQI